MEPRAGGSRTVMDWKRFSVGGSGSTCTQYTGSPAGSPCFRFVNPSPSLLGGDRRGAAFPGQPQTQALPTGG